MSYIQRQDKLKLKKQRVSECMDPSAPHSYMLCLDLSGEMSFGLLAHGLEEIYGEEKAYVRMQAK